MSPEPGAAKRRCALLPSRLRAARVRARCRRALSRLSTPPVAIVLRPAAASSNSRSGNPRVHKVSRCRMSEIVVYKPAPARRSAGLPIDQGCRRRPGPRGRPRRLPGGSVPGVIGLVTSGAVLEINAPYHSLPERQSIKIPLPRGPDRVQNRPSTPQTRSAAAGYGTTHDRQHGARGKGSTSHRRGRVPRMHAKIWRRENPAGLSGQPSAAARAEGL
jgi:hypothetical protein